MELYCGRYVVVEAIDKAEMKLCYVGVGVDVDGSVDSASPTHGFALWYSHKNFSANSLISNKHKNKQQKQKLPQPNASYLANNYKRTTNGV